MFDFGEQYIWLLSDDIEHHTGGHSHAGLS